MWCTIHECLISFSDTSRSKTDLIIIFKVTDRSNALFRKWGPELEQTRPGNLIRRAKRFMWEFDNDIDPTRKILRHHGGVGYRAAVAHPIARYTYYKYPFNPRLMAEGTHTSAIPGPEILKPTLWNVRPHTWSFAANEFEHDRHWGFYCGLSTPRQGANL